MKKAKWWGCRHKDGSIHVKRFFDHNCLENADKNELVDVRSGIFEASTKTEAKTILLQLI